MRADLCTGPGTAGAVAYCMLEHAWYQVQSYQYLSVYQVPFIYMLVPGSSGIQVVHHMYNVQYRYQVLVEPVPGTWYCTTGKHKQILCLVHTNNTFPPSAWMIPSLIKMWSVCTYMLNSHYNFKQSRQHDSKVVGTGTSSLWPRSTRALPR